ncbi:ORF157 [Staphylococcus phage 53]|uniref:ORF157 n=1 Tax=Staphylococcus phage 53 TaxID=2908098 RepID=Q4ZDL6_9CAUD|nr:ORF157 [Staphylococcus phage 53]
MIINCTFAQIFKCILSFVSACMPINIKIKRPQSNLFVFF